MADRYAELFDGFRWAVPERFNIAREACWRWAGDASRIAILREGTDGAIAATTFASLRDDAARLAAWLRAAGVKRGDIVAIAAAQRPETAATMLGILALGAIAMPLSILFGPEALAWRLGDSKAIAVVADEAGTAQLAATLVDAVQPGIRVAIGAPVAGWSSWSAIQCGPVPTFDVADTASDDAAFLIYTSGTTGNPKGALLAHSALLGNLPGFVSSQNGFPQGGPNGAGDVFWSPADWAWTGGLWDALMPTLYFGMPLVANDAKVANRFDPARAFEVLERFGVTNTFLFPTALKSMMKAVPEPRSRYRLRLRAVMSAGEPVGEAVFDWCERALGVRINEMFGQTEMNYIVGNSAWWPARAGSMGRPYPGHRVGVIDDQGREVAAGGIGEVALDRRWRANGRPQRDPVLFLGYWNNQAATRAKFTDDWCRTGDLARIDADGTLWYQGRADDVFKSSGYRIGPTEIENCLTGHADVVHAAVVGKPDPERTNIVKAFVVLVPGRSGSQALVAELQQLVRSRLAPYETPREIEFVDELPMTTTGKLQRRLLRDR